MPLRTMHINTKGLFVGTRELKAMENRGLAQVVQPRRNFLTDNFWPFSKNFFENFDPNYDESPQGTFEDIRKVT